jgi:2-phosphoglycerate kinase
MKYRQVNNINFSHAVGRSSPDQKRYPNTAIQPGDFQGMNYQRSWDVLLIGGASGVGKSSISYRLAHSYNVGITEVDDFQVILERMTTPEQYPVLHFWRTHSDETRQMDGDQQLAIMINYSQVMSVALEHVIANHLESQTPIVFEGDYIPPSLAVLPVYGKIPAQGRVRALIVVEEDEQQILRNYCEREGGMQAERAHISWLHSKWLQEEATRLGVPTLAARPWETVFERAQQLIESFASEMK